VEEMRKWGTRGQMRSARKRSVKDGVRPPARRCAPFSVVGARETFTAAWLGHSLCTMPVVAMAASLLLTLTSGLVLAATFLWWRWWHSTLDGLRSAQRTLPPPFPPHPRRAPLSLRCRPKRSPCHWLVTHLILWTLCVCAWDSLYVTIRRGTRVWRV
jgi:hypothetical protein